jgi:hypothetical protein
MLRICPWENQIKNLVDTIFSTRHSLNVKLNKHSVLYIRNRVKENKKIE